MYEKLTEFSAVYKAYRKTAKGKHSYAEVISYESSLHMHLWYLQQRLFLRQFTLGKYHKFMIYDPKVREIQALSFSDRVFQQLLCEEILKPYLDNRLIYDNAACREGKGTHFALNRFTIFLRDHFKNHGTEGYILKFDIRKYFDSIDHEILKGKLSKFPDEEVKELLYHIVDSFEKSPGKGLPMGNQSSQWFALYYLDRLDRFIKENLRVKHYVRYMDDGVLVLESRESARECLRLMREVLAEDKLEFNEKTQIFPITQGCDFLGWHFYLTDSGKVIKKLRNSNKKRFKRRIKAYQKKYESGEMDFDDISKRLKSYRGHLKYGHTYKLRKHIYGRMVFVRQHPEKQDEEIYNYQMIMED